MSRYARLADWLKSQPNDTTQATLTFTDIERILGRALPASARRYGAWWSNAPGSHVQARAWFTAGWRTVGVDIPHEEVTFRRETTRHNTNTTLRFKPTRTLRIRARPQPSHPREPPSRAPHNPGKTVALVACVKSKQTKSAPAKDLYTSALFKKTKAYAQKNSRSWYILSAKYGLLEPDEIIAPYEKTLKTMPSRERYAWAKRVLAALDTRLQPDDRVILLAGETYREHLVPALQAEGHEVLIPLQGLSFGKQLQWLTENT